MTVREGPILLGGYAAKQCPVRTQLDFGPAPAEWVPAPEDQARLDAGVDFEAEVFADLLRRHPGAVLVDPAADRGGAIAATVAAMDAGAPAILGGWLPDDVGGGRKGRPDILIAAGGGYLPADVKHHRNLEPKAKTTAHVASLDSPSRWQRVGGWSAATLYRVSDGLQLAHYTRMLQACGRHPGPHMLWGAVLGTTVVATSADLERVLTWHDLTEPLGFTFSRSRGKARRSLLERYDHEHAFRVLVADAARQAAQGRGRLIVEPVGQAECRTCPYQQICADQMGPHEPSTALTVGGLDVREWVTLRRMGITTVDELAALDTSNGDFLDTYHREVSHRGRDHARSRLTGASTRAAMIRDGVSVLRTSPLSVPAVDIEIDCDIEWSADGLVYLWGARVRLAGDESTAVFVPFADWSMRDSAAERALAERFADWVRGIRDTAALAGRTVRVYHWSPAEASRLQRILGAAAADLLDPDSGVFTDLEQVFNASFLSVHGSSIKVVAPLFGFTWSAPDAGGALSQTHLDTVQAGQTGAEASRNWLLAYNADDTAALAAIRDGMKKS
ncbi:MAG: ribonuclease H-like domain-containing protein [Mycobacterium sp.]